MSNVPNDVELYHEMVASSVDLSNAYVSKDGVLTVTRSVRDLDNNKRRRFLYTMLLPEAETRTAAAAAAATAAGDQDPLLPSTTIRVLPPSEYHDQVKLRLPSPSGKKIAMFRQEGDVAANKASNILEIWNGPCLEQRIILSSPDNQRHGKIIYDAGGFGQPNWSSDDKEQFLLYAAERNPIKTQTFFATTTSSKVNIAAEGEEKQQQPTDQTTGRKSESSISSSSPVVGASFTLGVGKLEGWGEKYTKQSPLLDLYLVHTGTGHVGRIENVPGSKTLNVDDGVTLGQGVLSPSLSHVVYTAWHVDTKCDDDISKNVNDEKDSESPPIRMSRRFGLIYCQQRPCRMYASPIQQLVQQLSTPTLSVETSETAKDGGFVCLTPNYRLAVSPRFGPITVKDTTAAAGGTPYAPMVFLSSPKGFDTHSGCLALSTVDWNNEGPDLATLRVIVDQVVHPKDSPPDQIVANLNFPGLFVQSLPDPCVVQESDDHHQLAILTTTQWGSVQRIVRISLATGKITLLPLQQSSSYASQALLGVTSAGGAVVAESSPDQPASLAYLSPLQVSNSTASSGNTIPFAPILGSSICSSTLSPIHRGPWGTSYEVLNLKPPPIGGVAAASDDDMFPLQCILMRPSTQTQKSEKVPLLVVVHGGPHGCSPTTFLPAYAYLCASGYAVLMVNYRGSTGFGQAGIDILPGRVGTLDVEDVVYATNAVVEQHYSWIDADRLGIIGGSHGGFLTGHLTGQYPDMFQVAAMRNPVTNIASMITATDIPDWCLVEGLSGSFDWTKFSGPTHEELVSMYSKSPIAHVQKVTTPTLVALGLSDQRVPPSQGLEWYYTLRSKGVPTKLLLYEDNDHAIDGVESEADHWINIKRWMDEYLMIE